VVEWLRQNLDDVLFVQHEALEHVELRVLFGPTLDFAQETRIQQLEFRTQMFPARAYHQHHAFAVSGCG
jgi:hypothetical protein